MELVGLKYQNVLPARSVPGKLLSKDTDWMGGSGIEMRNNYLLAIFVAMGA